MILSYPENPNKGFEALIQFSSYKNQEEEEGELVVMSFVLQSGNILKFYDHMKMIKAYLKDNGLIYAWD